MAAATIEERLRLYGSKTRCFCPKKNGAWTHFSPLSLSHGFLTIQPSPGKGTRRSRAASMSEQGELRNRLIRANGEWR